MAVEFRGVTTLVSDDAGAVETSRRSQNDSAAIERLSRESVQALYDTHQRELLAFLIGVLRNVDDGNEVVQITFRRLLEAGDTADEGTRKGWLFKVALHEALNFRRQESRHDRHLKAYSTGREGFQRINSIDGRLLENEEVSRLRQLLTQLPSEQQHVVRQRIYEEKTFAAIASELNVPVGTVLTRMRLALEKLRKWFGDE